jgi:hypothetical protein
MEHMVGEETGITARICDLSQFDPVVLGVKSIEDDFGPNRKFIFFMDGLKSIFLTRTGTHFTGKCAKTLP